MEMVFDFLPTEFIKRMEADLGSDLHAFLSSYEDKKVCALRLNPLKAEAKTPDQLRGYISDEKVEWCETGYYYDEDMKPGHHPYHNAGVFYIQDASAMAPVELLGVEPGMKVLDLCAAPGGKSTQIAGKLQGEGLLICNEPMKNRAKILSENIERLGVTNAVVTSELPDALSAKLPEFFDRILVDAPCSGEGMFRKNHDACKEWSLENVQICADRQDEILNNAYIMLKPGGYIAYSTCTFARLEDEGTIERFVNRYPDMTVVSLRRLWPHEIKGEGHFEALLRKEGQESLDQDQDLSEKKSKRSKKQKENATFKTYDKNVKILSEYKEFCDKYFCKKDLFAENIWVNGDQIYAIPKDYPDMSGLHVLRAGVFLGTIKKNRFEPSHAMALALKKEDVNRWISLPADGEDIKNYLNGQTIICDDKDCSGWTLILVDNYSVGWGKVTNGLVKNHYPKGLRINYEE